MSGYWLVILVLYGAIVGWGEIHPLSWWLLVPMAMQDAYDAERKR